MTTVTSIRRGNKMAICLTNHMCGEIVAGAGYSLKGDFNGVTEIVLCNQSMFDQLERDAPGLPDGEIRTVEG